MRQFEYKTLYFNTPACEGLDEDLNKLGKSGWELVSVCPTNCTDYGISGVTAFLKKEIIK